MQILLKYTDKVYKVKSDDNNEYCLKYCDDNLNTKVIEKELIDMIEGS